MLIAIVAALAAGGSFAAGGVLQQRAASERPEGEALSFRLIIDLAQDPTWLLGMGFAIFSYALESLALAFGPLVLVQPLIVIELIFALPIAVRWRGLRMSKRVWAGTLSVAFGLAIGLASASPGKGRPAAPLPQWIMALAIVAGLAVLAVTAGRREQGPLRPSLYALGAGIGLGTQAALLKATVAEFQSGIVPALEGWQLWTMLAAAVVSLILLQSAYEAGPLAASMPVVDAVEPSVAIVFGIALFHEHIRTGLWLVGIAVGLVMLFGGIVLLDTSPLVQRLQRVERHQRELDGAEGAGASQGGSAGPAQDQPGDDDGAAEAAG